MAILTDAFVREIVSTIQTNRARCILYKKILDLFDEESVSVESSGRLSLYIRREVLPRMFEKVSRSLKTIQTLFGPLTYLYIYMDTNTDHFTLLALRVRGNYY